MTSSQDNQSTQTPKFKRAFSRRVFIIIILTLVLSGMITGGLGFWLTYRTVQRGKISRSEDLLLYLAANAEHGVVSRDDTFLQPAFKKLLQSKAISGVAVYNAKGELLFSKERAGAGTLPTTITIPDRIVGNSALTLSSSTHFRLVISPVFGSVYNPEAITFGAKESASSTSEVRGYAVMKLQTALSQEEMKECITTALILFLAVVLIGTILAFAAAAKIANPIQNIIIGVDKFSRGDLHARIPVKTHDEMGQISYYFNRLAKNLAQRMEELENWGKVLEQEVQKRTTEVHATRKFLANLISPLSGATSSWENIIDEIIAGSGAVAAALYHLPADGGPALLAKKDPAKLGLAFNSGECTAPITEMISGGAGDDPLTLTWFPLMLHEQIHGQLVLCYKETQFTPGFVSQVLSALTITLVNIHSFDSLRKMQHSLEEKNRTLKGQQAELIAQKKQIEETSKLKSEFLANVSHELRTPINAIIGYSEMITAGYYGEVTGEQAERMEAIEESGRNLLNLINTILDHSRMEAGKLPIYVEKIDDLRKLIKDTIGRNQSLARERPYSITSELPDFPVSCLSDGGKIQQILTNLISNAVKFTEAGFVVVSLGTKGGDLVLSVRDSGAGIREADQEAIFDAFKQSDGSSTRSVGGTGLGLSVVKKLSTLIGGDIQVESSPGKGSLFTLTFPRHLRTPEPA